MRNNCILMTANVAHEQTQLKGKLWRKVAVSMMILREQKARLREISTFGSKN
jgi:hypothetical protein